MLKVMHILKDDWKINVVVFTMDASAESKEGPQVAEGPSFRTDCFKLLHIFNLIIDDYFRAHTDFLSYVNRLHSCTFLLALLRDI